jgi:hypothetical protein
MRRLIEIEAEQKEHQETVKQALEITRQELDARQNCAPNKPIAKAPPHPPKWNNKEAVAEFVRHRPLRLVPVIEMRVKTQREAIADAMAGDFAALANEVFTGEELSLEARVVLTLILDEKIKKPKHRPKQTKIERALLSVLPDAERAYVEIREYLKACCPGQSTIDIGQSTIDIRDIAITLAAEQFKLNEESLRNYINRADSDPSRLTPRVRFPT